MWFVRYGRDRPSSVAGKRNFMKLSTTTLKLDSLLPATGKPSEVLQVGGSFLVVGDASATRVADRETGRLVATEHGVLIGDLVSLSPNGAFLSIGEEQESAELYRVAASGLTALDIPATHDGVVATVAFDTGHMLVYYFNNNESSSATLYDEDGEVVREIREDLEVAVRGPTPSTFVAALGYTPDFDEAYEDRKNDKNKPHSDHDMSYVLLADTTDEDLAVNLMVPGSQERGEVRIVAAGGDRVAGLTDDGTLHVWAARSGELVASFTKQFGAKNGETQHRIAIAGNQPLVAIADDKSQVTLIRDRERIANVPTEGAMGGLAFSERWLVVAHGPYVDVWTIDRLEHVGRATCPQNVRAIATHGSQVYVADAQGAVHVTTIEEVTTR
jgi:hypothetical protein